jgi:Protein of unknown function (DUF4232)
MRAGASLGWRVAVVVAFGATAAVAVIVSRGGPVGASLSAARGAATQQAAVPRCTASGLRISLGAGTRVTGSDGASLTAYPLEFTNVSGAACILIGYPAVTAYQGDHVQVGLAAGRDVTATARRILLAPGRTAHASVDAVAPQARCRPVRAAGLRVAPPGQATARFVRRPLTACSARDVHGQGFLRVAAIQSGPGSSAGASA